MDLELKSADGNELDFAWSLYGPFVRQNLFSDTPGRRSGADWNESAERLKFQNYWAEGNKYVITVDNKPVGWAAIAKDPAKVIIENWHLTSEWQEKDIATIILGDLMPKWRTEGLQVEASVLQDSPTTSATESLLKKLGFTEDSVLSHSKLMRAL